MGNKSKSHKMRNIKLVLEYDGTNFYGWELQPDKRTIRGELIKAVRELTGENVKVYGASRTDKGVHALGQVAHFKTNSKLSIEAIHSALNHFLPEDIYVKDVEEAPLDFHARKSAKGKIYIYRIYFGKSPLLRNYVWEFGDTKADIEIVRKVMPKFLGRHRFDKFAYRDSGICNIKRFEIMERKNEWVFMIEGDRFLHRMVRILVGTLMDLATGKITEKRIDDMLNLESHKRGTCAPPQGLYLLKVLY